MRGQLALLTTFLCHRHRRLPANRAALVAWQDRRARALLRAVLPRSPFYRAQFAGLAPADWRRAPLINKATMMAHFDALNTVGVNKEAAFALALRAENARDFSATLGGVTVGLSSGTSGNRGLFLVSQRERWRWAGAVLARVLPDPWWAPQRVAFFLRANSTLYGTVASRRVRFAFFDLLDPLEAHVARLNTLQPTLLVGPPSLLRFLAESKHLRIRPRKIVSVAEVLDPLDEAVIAAAFDQTVHQVYQCTEGFLGYTCARGVLHLNEDLVAVQRDALDADARTFAPIVTDLYRVAQPIIRYRLDDVLTARAAPCPCGLPLTALDRIEGRCDDVFQLPACHGDRWVAVFPDFVRRAVLAGAPIARAYRARQRSPAAVEVALDVDGAAFPDAAAGVRAALDALWLRVGARPPALRVIPLEPERPGPDKRKRVARCFPLEGPPR